ncbi:hypothetical protein GOBAR_AA37007 [Gossypium barbadense]|uniref:Peroxin-5 n=1 Tax=Gossypium barbadense TaxID=3634 RepID=A0A2P5VXX8_GOSBA|nr:hypothetical protein GOBAR_AA37007 [Gossypium barbadense]
MELCVPSHRASNKCNVHVKLLDLRLQPGATQANSVQSADAILAYQQALDLKPNYVRAWANMGISYTNQTGQPVILIPARDIPFQGYPGSLLS